MSQGQAGILKNTGSAALPVDDCSYLFIFCPNRKRFLSQAYDITFSYNPTNLWHVFSFEQGTSIDGEVSYAVIVYLIGYKFM